MVGAGELAPVPAADTHVLAATAHHDDGQPLAAAATATDYVLVVASAISGLIVQRKFTGGTLALSALIVAVGLYGAVSAAKYHEPRTPLDPPATRSAAVRRCVGGIR